MAFDLDTVSKQLVCPDCGTYIKDISLSDGFEHMTAQLLQAKDAEYWQKGYDVYDSAFFPNKTFQVKYANALAGRCVTKTINGRELTFDEKPTWSFHEHVALSSDFYILFGVYDDLVFPFAVSVDIWDKETSKDGNGGRALKMSTAEKVKCGRYDSSYRKCKFWQYKLENWPDDLFSRIRYYEQHDVFNQVPLF